VSDPLSREERSKVMAAVRGSGNKVTELRLIAIFQEFKISGWRRGSKLPGKPDFVFHREKLAVFVDGCFWHGCQWHCRMPKSRPEFWGPKIARNKNRHRIVARLLREKEWRCFRIWEHSLRDPEKVAKRVLDALERGRIRPRLSKRG
jgi:DNA mismatch endonuclease (patch repair protein)